jgi:hypothetical protein
MPIRKGCVQNIQMHLNTKLIQFTDTEFSIEGN